MNQRTPPWLSRIKAIRSNALGPGLVTGAADDDPSGIATYSQAGAQFGGRARAIAGVTPRNEPESVGPCQPLPR